RQSTPVRCPTTAYHGNSWLLVFTPGPVHPSLANLNAADSSMAPILMASLVRTFRQHGPVRYTVDPSLRPSHNQTSQKRDYRRCQPSSRKSLG
ncbi:hypothetical protein KR018_002052, partial [Drosophila ironensis]